MNRIGPRMMDVLEIVARYPGCPKIVPARACGPNGSLNFGYRTVDRAISAGLVTATPVGRGYQLELTTEGQLTLDSGTGRAADIEAKRDEQALNIAAAYDAIYGPLPQ